MMTIDENLVGIALMLLLICAVLVWNDYFLPKKRKKKEKREEINEIFYPSEIKSKKWTSEQLFLAGFLAAYFKGINGRLVDEVANCIDKDKTALIRKINRMKGHLKGKDNGLSKLDKKYMDYFNRTPRDEAKSTFDFILSQQRVSKMKLDIKDTQALKHS